MKLLVLGSKKVVTDDYTGYRTFCDGDQELWTNESFAAGTFIEATLTVKGEKYADKDGVEQTYRGGLNFKFALGNLADVRSLIAGKAALTELEAI